MLVVQRRNNQSKTSDKGAQTEKMIKVNRSHKLTTRLCRWNKNLKKPTNRGTRCSTTPIPTGTGTTWRMHLLLPVRSGCLQHIKSPGTP